LCFSARQFVSCCALFYYSPYCFCCFLNGYKLDFIFRILLKLVLLIGKRDFSKNIYILKKQFTSTHHSGSADRECSGRTHLP